ncbi:MAG: MaoC/PaaZ C-terminal domain-containing protein [Thermincola sp.]|jgi:acyl dehydratase|nr:MaoC/PaaZ C-terminal domain-containing protein [Thermincola sp.]MDT3704212.1 MaoC/PaaZ C-terminal domain-containing protein [Thermincola sp.]
MGYQMRGKTFDEFNIGEDIFTAPRTITEADVVNFAGLSGDFNPLHVNEEFMKNSDFGSRIAHGALVAAISSGQANQLGIYEGTAIAVAQVTTRYTGAVRFGDTVSTVITCIDKKESKKPDRGVATFQVKVLNQRDVVVQEGEWVVILRRQV